MTKHTYLNRLETLLANLPQEERQEILDAYEKTFDAAGPDRQEETADRLETPEEAAERILFGEEDGARRGWHRRCALLLALAMMLLILLSVGLAALPY